jgi:hypothetical protein
VPYQDRFSKEKLKEELISDFSTWYDYDNPVPIKKNSKGQSRKKNSKKRQSRKKNKIIT